MARVKDGYPQDGWVVVETITEGGMTVVSVAGRQAEWQSVERRAPAFVPIKRLIREVAARRQAIDVDVPGDGGRSARVVVIPVPTPRGLCHGVQFWCGPSGATPPPPRSIAGCIWDFDRQICVQPYESNVMSGRESVYTEEVSLARILSLGDRYDEYAPVLQQLFAPEPGHRSQSLVTVPHAEGRLMRWQVNVIAHPPGVFTIWEDVTDVRPVEPPTLHQIGLDSAQSLGLNVAVIAPQQGTLAMFLTPPPDWVQYNYRQAGVSIFHPDDLGKLADFVDSDSFDSAEHSQSISIRILNIDNVYEPIDLTLRPYPDALGSGLVVGSFMRSAPSILGL